jgi:hypothetical protein
LAKLRNRRDTTVTQEVIALYLEVQEQIENRHSSRVKALSVEYFDDQVFGGWKSLCAIRRRHPIDELPRLVYVVTGQLVGPGGGNSECKALTLPEGRRDDAVPACSARVVTAPWAVQDGLARDLQFAHFVM